MVSGLVELNLKLKRHCWDYGSVWTSFKHLWILVRNFALELKNLVACGKVMSSKADETLRSGTNANFWTALLWKRTFAVNSGVIFNKKINRMGHLVIEFLRRIELHCSMEQFSQAVAQARWQHLVQQCFSIKTDDKCEPVKGKASLLLLAVH